MEDIRAMERLSGADINKAKVRTERMLNTHEYQSVRFHAYEYPWVL